MIEFVDKEDAAGLIAGSDFGSSVRIMARSPTHVLFNGLGLRVWNRKNGGSFTDINQVFSERPTKAKFEASQDKIDRIFGEGAGAAVVRAWKDSKTVLFDGGGEKLGIPRQQLREQHQAALAAVSINQTIPLEGRIPTCKQCGKNLQPKFTIHQMGDVIKPDHPRSLEDCQRMSNFQVVEVHDYREAEGPRVGYVKEFATWDGESVFDPHFCGDSCAALYGRRAAAEYPALDPNIKPPRVAWSHDFIKHFENPPARRMTLSDGKVIEY